MTGERPANLVAFVVGDKIRRTLARHPAERAYDLLVHDDGSTDGALDAIAPGIIVLRNPVNQGIGAAMKRVFQYALDHDYDALVIQAGNDKDDPLKLRCCWRGSWRAADFVQGSRYLGGGGFGNIGAYRVAATRMVQPLIHWNRGAQSTSPRAPTASAPSAPRSCVIRASTGARRGWMGHRAGTVSDAEGDPGSATATSK